MTAPSSFGGEKILPHRKRRFLSFRRKSDSFIFWTSVLAFLFALAVLVYKLYWEAP